MLNTKKISKDLISTLRSNENIKPNDMLSNVFGVIEEEHPEHSLEFDDMISCYGPDTTVSDLIKMASTEEPNAINFSSIFNKLAFWR